ncbi:hypothetical protein D3C78_1201290 [compost metagenome]
MAVARCIPAHGGGGGQVDHRTVAFEVGVAGAHQAQGGHGAGVDAFHEVFVADVEDASQRHDLRIVDQDIQAAEGFRHLGHAAFEIGCAHHVALHRQRIATTLADFFHSLFERGAGAARYGDLGALGSEGEGDALADALTATRDQRHLALQHVHA